MKTAPITPARIEFDAAGRAVAPDFGDVYASRGGALAQARHVFLGGNALPARWAERRRFTIVETGFGLGTNFIAAWQAWRDDPARPRTLHFVSIDRHPPRRADLERAHAGSPLAALADRLIAQWPPLTGDLHRLVFETGRVELLLAFGDARQWLPRLNVAPDAVFLDGFAPAHNVEMWDRDVFDALGRIAAAGCTAATWSAARVVRDGLARAGFEVASAAGFDTKREMTLARFAPRFSRAPLPRTAAARPDARDAVVVGAGIAGAAVAAALADEGIAVTLLDAQAAPATRGSGNEAGIFRAIVAYDDGAHARWYRAAAYEARRAYAPLVASGAVPGELCGVLHLADDGDPMRDQRAAPRWPADFVEALDPAEASRRAGLALAQPAWHFKAGGWIAPAAATRHLVAASGARFIGGAQVAAIERDASEDRWRLLDAAGRVLAGAGIVVLANAAAAAQLAPWASWRFASSRGQVTRLPATTAGLARPALPLAGHGYVIALPEGGLLCGATQSRERDSADLLATALRAEDHAHNLAVAARLTGRKPRVDDVGALDGRVGWRTAADDRLPIAGAVPARAAAEASPLPTQVKRVAREPGLFVLTALGARGLTSTPLAARLVAAAIVGAPLPVDRDLVDALDPARHLVRIARHREAETNAQAYEG